MKTNFSEFLKTKFWSTFQENHSFGFSRKEWMGYRVLVLRQDVAPGLCVCDHPCRKPSDPFATMGLPVTAIHPLVPTAARARQGVPGFICCILSAPASTPGSSAGLPDQHSCSQCRHSNTPALKMDRRAKLAAVSFSLFSPRFCTGCVKLSQKLAVPLFQNLLYFASKFTFATPDF